MYRILIFRFISSHHPISCSTFLDQFYESLAKVLGIEVVKDGVEVTWPHFVEYLLKTNPEQDVSRIRDIFRRILDVLFMFNAIQVLSNQCLAECPLKLFFNLIQFFSNSSAPEHILKVLFDPIQFFSFRTRIGGLTRNSAHRAWSTSPSLSTSKRRQLLN